MKKTLVLACCLALVAVAGFAQAPSPHQVTLADIMAPAAAPAPAATAPAPATQNQPLFLSNHRRGGLQEKVTCSASCGSYNVTCTTTSLSNCSAQDRNCAAGLQGYVSCDGNPPVYCTPSCTQICTPGTTRYVWDGYTCCDEGGKDKEEQQCSPDGTAWVYTGNFICMGLCGPRIP